MYDKHHGKSGTYIGNKDGTRSPATPDKDGNVTIGDQVLHRPVPKPHSDGDAPRDEAGERTDRGAAQQAAAKPQPAIPEAPTTPPWATPAEAAAERRTTRRRSPSDELHPRRSELALERRPRVLHRQRRGGRSRRRSAVVPPLMARAMAGLADRVHRVLRRARALLRAVARPARGARRSASSSGTARRSR
jgi:hypothetical protein